MCAEQDLSDILWGLRVGERGGSDNGDKLCPTTYPSNMADEEQLRALSELLTAQFRVRLGTLELH